MSAERLARRAWYRLPVSTRKRLYPPLRDVYGVAAKLVEAARGIGPVQWAAARGPAKGEPTTLLRAVIAGSQQDIRSLSNHLFESPPEVDQRERTPLRRVTACVEEGLRQADLALLALPRLFRGLVLDGCTVLPGGVEVVIPVEAGLARWRAGGQPLGSYRRKIEQEGLRFEVHADAGALVRFYERFYRPYTQARFHDVALITPFADLERFGSQAEVLTVYQGDRQVAALLGIRHEDRYRYAAVGYPGGDSRYLSMGAGHALHAFGLERAATCGYSVLDMGPIRPFLDDPVFRYRRAWGAQLRVNPWSTRLLALGIGRLTPAVSRLLRRAPLITERRGSLWGLTAPDPDGPGARLEEVAGRHEGIGLSGFLSVRAALAREE